MKYLLLIALALALLWWWRTTVRKSIDERNRGHEQAPNKPATPAQDMVACRQCGLHLPRAEAVAGRLGMYCSQSHHSAGENT